MKVLIVDRVVLKIGRFIRKVCNRQLVGQPKKIESRQDVERISKLDRKLPKDKFFTFWGGGILAYLVSVSIWCPCPMHAHCNARFAGNSLHMYNYFESRDGILHSRFELTKVPSSLSCPDFSVPQG